MKTRSGWAAGISFMLLLCAGSGLFAAGVWESGVPLPTGRMGPVVGVIDDDIYVVAGQAEDTPTTTANEVFDTATGTWSSRRPYTVGVANALGGVIGGKLYVVGGCLNADCWYPSNAMEVYDPVTDTWTPLAPPPFWLNNAHAAVLGGKLVLAGGRRLGYSCSDAVMAYDPASDSWSMLEPMPVPVFSGASAVLDGKLYIAGGATGGGSGEPPMVALDQLWIYDPDTDTWTPDTPMPDPQWNGSGAELDGELYVITGSRDMNSGWVPTVQVFNPQTRTWRRETDIPDARWVPGVATVDEKIYVLGGARWNPPFDCTTVDVFSIPNAPPVAVCQNAVVEADGACTAAASVDGGSYDPDGDAIVPSQDPPGPYPLGVTAVQLTVTDEHGASAVCDATVTVVDTTPPVVTCPDTISVTAEPGMGAAVVEYDVSAVDACGSATVVLDPPSGSLFPVGWSTVTATATDPSGNSASCDFRVGVAYRFSGFLPPVNDWPVANVLKAGAAVPVRFSLSGISAASVLAAGYPRSQVAPCDASVPVDGIEETVTAGKSGLTYDPLTDTYTYVWKTDKVWAGTCRQLVLAFDDGITVVRAAFTFK